MTIRAATIFRRTNHAIVATLVAAAGLGVTTDAAAQAPPPMLNENCIVSVLNRNVRVKPDGTWVLPNIPANFGLVRARATCVFDGATVSGESAPFLVTANGSVDVPRIVLGATTPIPQSVTVTSPAPQLGTIGQTVQLVVRATYANGSQRDVTAASTGTRYIISNPAIATITADGLVSARASGTVLVQATNEGTAGFTSVRVVLSADSDRDGIPDDVELTLGLNPNNPADAFEDRDRDGLSNLDETLSGTSLDDPDSDDDGLTDGEEARPGADGFVTNPLSADTDGDGVRDALEVASGSDPTNAASTNLNRALTGIAVTPTSFTIVVNSVVGEGSQQLTVVGTLRDGTTIDLTSTARGTNYQSSNLDVCTFGAPDGHVFGASDGSCTITVTNGGFAATAVASVTNFQPTALGSVAIPGYANNVDANGGLAYVAAGASGLVIVDVSIPAAPVIVSTTDTPGNANDVRVVGSRVYVADGTAGLRIFDVTTPTAPVLLGSLDTAGEANDVIVSGDFAYVADGASGVQIIDVSLPAVPRLVRTVPAGGVVRGVDVEGTVLVAVLDSPSGLRVIDVGTPASAGVVGTLPLAGTAIDVDVAGGIAVVAAYTGGVAIVDVRSPASPVLLSSLPGSSPTGFVPRDVQIAGRFALFAEQLFANAVAPIVDIENPAQPFFRALVDFRQDYAGTGIAISGPYVYWTGQSFVVSSENGTTGTTRLFIGQYIAIQDRGNIPPTITLTAPAPGATLVEGQQVTARADARDDVAVASVTFTVNGAVAFTDTSEPYEARLTVSPAPGPMVIGAQASDYGGNTATAAPVDVHPIPDPKTTVTGLVNDRDGNPVSGAQVSVLGVTGTTAGDGSFNLAGVPTVQGALVVQASASIAGRVARGFSVPTSPEPGGVTNVGVIRLTSGRIGLLHCDTTPPIRAALIASGMFTDSDIVEFTRCGTPTAAELAQVSAVLVWTNSTFANATAVGNALADFADAGGGVVIATYGQSFTWGVMGRFRDGGYAPLTFGPSGHSPTGFLNLAASNTAHPIMQGVGAAGQGYFFNSNYTNHALAPGATLVAVDTVGNEVVAVSQNNRVVSIAIFPGFAMPEPIQRLFANALDFVR